VREENLAPQVPHGAPMGSGCLFERPQAIVLNLSAARHLSKF
jgi:hypothetical protein